jgi:hypothetical protein
VAVHESAHATIGHLLGRHVVSVSIVPSDTELGWCRFADDPVTEANVVEWRRAIWASAHSGTIAERIFGERYLVAVPLSGGRDFDTAALIIVGQPDSLPDLEDMDRLVREQWPGIARVAVALLVAPTSELGREQFLAALEAPTTITLTEWLRHAARAAA